MDTPHEHKLLQLLKTPIDKIKTLCQVNKSYLSICHDVYFWEQKFEHDHLPMFFITYPLTIQGWVNVYHKTKNVLRQVNELMWIHQIESKHSDFLNMIRIGISQKDYPTMLEALPRTMLEQYYDFITTPRSDDDDINISIDIILTDDQYEMVFSVVDFMNDTEDHVSVLCDEKDVKKVLGVLLYHNPTIEILDANSNYILPDQNNPLLNQQNQIIMQSRSLMLQNMHLHDY